MDLQAALSGDTFPFQTLEPRPAEFMNGPLVTSQDCFFVRCWQIMCILTSQSGPSTLKLQVSVSKMCPVLVRPFMMKQAKSLDGAWQLQTLHMLCDGILQEWALVRIHRPPAQSPGFKFQLTILKQDLGNFVGDIDGISALSHWYWDIRARRPAS